MAPPTMNMKGKQIRRDRRAGFTLLEAMLAVFIFGLAAVSLVEAINASARTSLHARDKGKIQMRLDNMLLETTRDPTWMDNSRSLLTTEREVRDGGIVFTIRREPLELKNEEGQPLQGIYLVRVTARWLEAGREQRASAETWAYPLMFRPLNMSQMAP